MKYFSIIINIIIIIIIINYFVSNYFTESIPNYSPKKNPFMIYFIKFHFYFKLMNQN